METKSVGSIPRRAAGLAALFALVFVLVLALLPAAALADGTTYTSGDWQYTVSGGKAQVTKYIGSNTTPSIPSTLGSCAVTSIGEYAFFYTSITGVTIPNTVESIAFKAFDTCTQLKSLNIPSSVKSIAGYAFSNCTALESVTLPDTIESIGEYTFGWDSSLRSIVIPYTVKSIGDYAFNYCTQLTSVTIPNSVQSIGQHAFNRCYALSYLSVPSSVTSIGKSAFHKCGSLTLYGESGSRIQQYASANGISFVVAGGGSSTAPTSFYDVPSGQWYTDWVSQAAQRGLMTGYKDSAGSYTGYFGPDDSVTRAQVATVLWRIAGQPSTTTAALPDARGHWAETAIAWCQEQGIITGYTDGEYKGTFRPDASVTREEFAAMAYRFAKWAGVKIAGASENAYNKCADTGLVGWSHDYMVWCAAAGVITGKEMGGACYLAPQETATRAQAAKILVQIAKMAGGEISPYGLDEGDAGEADALYEDAAAVEEPTFDEVTFEDVTGAETETAGTAEATETDETAETPAADETAESPVTEEPASFEQPDAADAAIEPAALQSA